ncbi:MAG: CysZ protein [Methylophagaceae bacterium]|jgi:CysZ protein
MDNLLKGAGYLLKGFNLMNQRGIRRFAYLPMAINFLLFSIAIWLGFNQFDSWLNNLLPTWLPDWLFSAIMWLIMPIFTALVSIIVFFSFSILANFLASPFNGPLAEAVEKKLTGQAPPSLSMKQIFKDLPSVLWNEIKKIKYFLLWIIPLFIFSWIPIVNIIAPILWFVFSSWILTLQYHDYPMGNHQIKFPEQREKLRVHRTLALGFGLSTLAVTMIPILNFIVIPAAVAGATALYLEKIKV